MSLPTNLPRMLRSAVLQMRRAFQMDGWVLTADQIESNSSRAPSTRPRRSSGTAHPESLNSMHSQKPQKPPWTRQLKPHRMGRSSSLVVETPQPLRPSTRLRISLAMYPLVGGHLLNCLKARNSPVSLLCQVSKESG